MPATPETRAMVLMAAQICEEKKGTDTRILELDPVDSGLTDFFLITSGSNNRQTGAIADEIELRMKRDFSTYARSVEGRRNGDWILLDYVDFVVHIFTEQTRAFYDIERLRKSAQRMDTAELATLLKPKARSPRKAPAKKTPAKQSAAKTTAKKVAAKKTAPEKTAAKKTAAKKTAAKKAVPKPRTPRA